MMGVVTEKKKDPVLSAFKNSLKVVKLSEDEFHTDIDSAFRKKRTGRPQGTFGKAVNASVQQVCKTLRSREDYNPLFLTDEDMAIDQFSEYIGDRFLTSVERAAYREKFRELLAREVEGVCIHIYGSKRYGLNPDCIYVWKVPAVHGNMHAGMVAKAVMEC